MVRVGRGVVALMIAISGVSCASSPEPGRLPTAVVYQPPVTGSVTVQGATISIRGTVSTLDGRPIANARVAVSEVDSSLDDIECPRSDRPSALETVFFTFANAIEDLVLGFLFGQTPERLDACPGGKIVRSDGSGDFSLVITERVGTAYLGFGVAVRESLTSFRLSEESQALPRLEVIEGPFGRVRVDGTQARVRGPSVPWNGRIETRLRVGGDTGRLGNRRIRRSASRDLRPGGNAASFQPRPSCDARGTRGVVAMVLRAAKAEPGRKEPGREAPACR